jgi:RimJ/RimL family protein N-acetyltransferase
VPGIDALALTIPEQLADRIVEALAAAIPLPPMRSGTARVARWIGALAVGRRPHQTAISLRPALPSDAYTLWVWANDAATRAASFDRLPIEWEEHRAWIAQQLGDTGVLMLIAEGGDHRPLGVIRFDADPAWTRARLSYGLAERVRGQGLGTTLVRSGFEALRALHPQAAVRAEVSPANIPSLRIFRKLGWDERSHADRITFEIAGRA